MRAIICIAFHGHPAKRFLANRIVAFIYSKTCPRNSIVPARRI
jgi:hypothetical protein